MGRTYVLGLVVLQDAADGSGSGAQRAVQAVHVLLPRVRLRLGAEADLEVSALVVEAVAAADQLLVLALEGEPRLEIKLLAGGVVESAADNGHDLVGETQALVELLADANHVLKRLPALLGVRQEELLNLYNRQHHRLAKNIYQRLCLPFQTGARGKYPRLPCRGFRLPCDNKCCALRT